MNEVFNRLLNAVPLETSLINSAMLKDNHNWVNGEYTGNIKQIEIDVTYTMDLIKRRLKVLYPNQNFDEL